MKTSVLSLACVVALCAACSAPKMAYKFDYHDYNAGRKSKDVNQEVASNPGPTPIQPESLVAVESTSENTPVLAPETKTYDEMSKKERRAFVKEIKKELKKEIKKETRKSEKKDAVTAAKGIDRDLKLAAIFGAVGIVGLIIGGQVFWIIGGIAMIIGVVFFVRWLIRQ